MFSVQIVGFKFCTRGELPVPLNTHPKGNTALSGHTRFYRQ